MKKSLWNKLSVVAAALTAAGLSAQAGAVGRLVDVSVYDRNEGRELQVYYHGGKYYVAGKPGNEYQVTLRNQTSDDVLGVMAVDGVNVITGQSATWNQSGYVLNEWNATDVKGWRKSKNDIARFYFTDLPDSYAARTDRPDDVGVIGVAVFRRKAERPNYEDDYRWNDQSGTWRRQEESRAPASGAPAPARPSGEQAAKRSGESSRAAPSDSVRGGTQPYAEQELGTGHGRREASSVRYTDFERASSQPDEVITIYYDSYNNLLARGIVPEPRYYSKPHRPHAFPGRFVPDPPRYRW